VLHISISMIYIHLQQVLLSHLAFLGFDSLWNTPLGKCYNSRSMRLWILLWLLGLSLVFSGVIARTHNLVMTLINANSQTTNPPRTRHNFTMPSFEQVEPFSSMPEQSARSYLVPWLGRRRCTNSLYTTRSCSYCTMRTALDFVVHRVPRIKPACLSITPKDTLARSFILVLHLQQCKSSRIEHLQN
jgi:hypothetical protein